MIYKMTVFLTRDSIIAVQVRDREEKYMSFRGNTSMPIESVDDVDDFIEHCYDEYNINDFSELDFEVFIVNVGGNADIYYALIKSFRNCRKVNAAETSTLLPLALAAKQSVKKGQAAVVGFLGSAYKAVCDKTGYIDIEDSAEKPKITLETSDFSFLHDVNISGFAGDEDEIKRIKAECEKEIISIRRKAENDKIKADDLLKEAQKTIQQLQEENRRYKPFYEAAEKERKRKYESRAVVVADFFVPKYVDAPYFVFNDKFRSDLDNQNAYKKFIKGINVNKGDTLGKIVYTPSGSYERREISTIEATQHGVFYFFNRFFKERITAPRGAIGIASLWHYCMNDGEKIAPNDVIGIYANEGDTRETAIAWYNKTYNAHEE